MVFCFLAWARVSFPVLPSSFQIANYIFSSSVMSISFPDAPSSVRFPSFIYYTCPCLLWRIRIWNLPTTPMKPPHNSENASVARHSAQCISDQKPGPQLCVTNISPTKHQDANKSLDKKHRLLGWRNQAHCCPLPNPFQEPSLREEYGSSCFICGLEGENGKEVRVTLLLRRRPETKTGKWHPGGQVRLISHTLGRAHSWN